MAGVNPTPSSSSPSYHARTSPRFHTASSSNGMSSFSAFPPAQPDPQSMRYLRQSFPGAFHSAGGSPQQDAFSPSGSALAAAAAIRSGAGFPASSNIHHHQHEYLQQQQRLEREQWEEDLRGMAGRIVQMRERLRDGLERETGSSWKHITDQIGMFSYTGLTKEQVKACEEKGVFMLASGRVSMAGLNDANVDATAKVMADAIKGSSV